MLKYNATTLVDAKVRAGGSIYIYGVQTKQINKETLLRDYYRKIICIYKF
jgi:hypothetical protein